MPSSPRTHHYGRKRAEHVVGDAVGDAGRLPGREKREPKKTPKRKKTKQKKTKQPRFGPLQQLRAELLGVDLPPRKEDR